MTAKSVRRLNLPLTAYMQPIPPTRIMELTGTCALLRTASVSENGRLFVAAKEYATLDPESKNQLQAPNTEIIIPTATSFPPISPNNSSATAEAGAERDAS